MFTMETGNNLPAKCINRVNTRGCLDLWCTESRTVIICCHQRCTQVLSQQQQPSTLYINTL